MRLTQYNVWVCARCTELELDWLYKKLLITRKVRGRSEYESLLIENNTRDGSHMFGAGLLRLVLAHAGKSGMPVELIDRRTKPCEPLWSADLSWTAGGQRHQPNESQMQALRALIDAGQGLIQAPTAYGKGVLLGCLPRLLPCSWLILVQDRALLEQLGNRVANMTGKATGRIGDGHWSTATVTIAMIQSLYSRLKDGNKEVEKWLGSIRAVAVDEVHGVASSSGLAILRALHRAWFRLGLSATPFGRSDARDIHVVEHLGRIVHLVSDQQMEQEGKIAKTEIRIHRVGQRGVNDYSCGGYKNFIELSAVRNAEVARIWRFGQRPLLTFVKGLDHGQYLLQIAQQIGLRAAFIEGATPAADRAQAIAAFEEGRIDSLIASNAMKQGVDIIHVRELINAAADKAIIPTIQRKGRGGRVCRAGQAGTCPMCADGGIKNAIILHDFYDLDLGRTGKKLLECCWIEKHSRARIKTYKDRGFTITME